MTDPPRSAPILREFDKKQLSETVAAYVREAIMVGELRPSAYIRTEHLATQLGVSATPVREALMILQSEGTVRWEPRRGFRVVPMSRGDVVDLFEVQAFIAGELAARSATLLPAAEITRLRTVQADLEAAARAGDTVRVDTLNHEIHRTINRAPEAGRLTSMLLMTVHYVPHSYFGRVRGWAEASAHDHDAIFVALENRDADGARLAMQGHIRHIGQLLADHLAAGGAFTQRHTGSAS
ncbi:GntR family transcriptional regulator [Pseudonocardia sp. GCM10023141]|uniref:GntR family transcriptional regulator n=1 Tax=Pseudonocardia sp. GCM10023141 TaxID=3252653 RepID=UPI003621FD64